jgi:hypothetical protein
MEKIYIKPKITLISDDTYDLGYYAWLKSRKEVITDLNGNSFMKDLSFFNNWINEIPNEFKVDTELVNKFNYRDRIVKMNLQYNNFDYYVFEIHGSMLFRDLLFNINNTAQWATSTRLLFSMLDNTAVYDSKNYHISEEYKDISSWEEQFEIYMNAIKTNRKTDISRLEMPYSISSYFWWGCNKKVLLNLLLMMKTEMPFFYNVYGKQFLRELDIDESMFPSKIDASILQYFRSQSCNDMEGVRYIDDDVYVTSRMSLVLYSQFIRQSSTCIKGLFNKLKHENYNINHFSDKVFKGNTTFIINYSANRNKVNQTISNRLCAFAMSSGTGPESWSYFLNNFLSPNITVEEFKKLLPCTFDEKGKLFDCKFREDIKFRNEGKEIAICPCPIALNSMEVAERKRSDDNNLIGNMYYELTKELVKL